MLSRKRSIMSDALKEEIAKEIGIYDTVQQEGWGGIKSRDAGNMVKHAVEMAERNMQKQ
ncbi:small acid-soluble spore protein F (minor alpha/beta-type SASP) [Natribacillus halophilus]|uniref:Small acid-soluble spore protein F (Minor alpha/beta-type SASP) n=1 Tax=Natribacillus halophilus TaxID=549003 RepID=A0A1G8RK89_9BACI|nr:small acid-soluble spore protein F (minor alpha/beta-type SASP) [Natribacillus halophilus]